MMNVAGVPARVVGGYLGGELNPYGGYLIIRQSYAHAWTEYFDEDKNKFGKMYTKWGGFIDGVDEFDPLFFNISPRDAQFIDPQERIFLECVYHAIEDAGYTKDNIVKTKKSSMGAKVGVYVGVMYEEYQLYGAQEQTKGRMLAIGGNPSSIANRVSYVYNFHGPSMSIDTMCSSSLTAVHLACQAIYRGECEVAIAGGVNVTIHPNKYLLLSQGKFASSKGRCESFGKGGDGYVPGEGVGAIILKPLSKAKEDGDHIYGIIKGSMLNAGGKTNGYTVPNPVAQGELIKETFERAGVNARDISYIEAHGTGTSLGDPIEINGLTRAFGKYTEDKGYCAIGSVKSNIGHCESAAGISAITKVLLQMKHGEIAPSLHAEELNPNIDFDKTPFVVQRQLGEWKRPVIEKNGSSKEIPRIAGISSFGAGGANAHLVIEEYIDRSKKEVADVGVKRPVVIVVSGKDNERLKESVENLLKEIEEGRYQEDDLESIAYTLQTGREAMEERLGFTAETIKEMGEKLKEFLNGNEGILEIYYGHAKHNREMSSIITSNEVMSEAIEKWVRQKNHEKILELWVKGLNYEWERIDEGKNPGKISLPSYPFAKEKYWVEIKKGYSQTDKSGRKLHPLTQENTSDLMEQRFSSVFSGEEFFLKDHEVNGLELIYILQEIQYNIVMEE